MIKNFFLSMGSVAKLLTSDLFSGALAVGILLIVSYISHWLYSFYVG